LAVERPVQTSAIAFSLQDAITGEEKAQLIETVSAAVSHFS
jgi:hypothetical protein